MAAPSIPREEFDAFLALLKDDPEFPSNYDEWLKRRAEERAKEQARGAVADEVVVHAKDFADYCRRSRLDANLTVLLGFAIVQARRDGKI